MQRVIDGTLFDLHQDKCNVMLSPSILIKFI